VADGFVFRNRAAARAARPNPAETSVAGSGTSCGVIGGGQVQGTGTGDIGGGVGGVTGGITYGGGGGTIGGLIVDTVPVPDTTGGKKPYAGPVSVNAPRPTAVAEMTDRFIHSRDIVRTPW
jgi:hypothetical protein